MRVMVLVPASALSEAGEMPSTAAIEAMTAYNEELAKAGVILAGEGLKPTSEGAQVRHDADGKKTVVGGPFSDSKELIAGFWIWQVKSLDEAIEWARRAPFPDFGVESMTLQIRRIFEAEDFGDQLTPELREREERLRAQAPAQ